MSKKELIKYLIENNAEVPVFQVLLGMLAALALGLLIYAVYKKTYTGVMYSKEFNTTIVMLCMITTLVIMIIGSNLALSLGMVGALSIIRFRTAVKDAKDAGYLFWAIGVGLSCGTGIYTIGIIGSAVIAFVLIFLYRLKNSDDSAYLLVVQGEDLDLSALENDIKKFSKKCNLKMTHYTESSVEATYELSLKANEIPMMQMLNEKTNITDVHLISYNGEVVGT